MAKNRTVPYYPMCADLNGRACVVIGGGLVAQRKTTTLLSYGARVTVISPAVTKRLERLARQGAIRRVPRPFRPGDLQGAWLVYAATDDEAVNRLVSRTASARRVFANVVDRTPLCTFIAPAIFRRGPLTVAVSTGRGSPSLAKKIRRDLGRTIGSAYVPMLRLLAGLRAIAKRKLPSYRDRKRYFDRLVSGRTFALVRAGQRGAARQEALALLERRSKNGLSSK